MVECAFCYKYWALWVSCRASIAQYLLPKISEQQMTFVVVCNHVDAIGYSGILDVTGYSGNRNLLKFELNYVKSYL